MNNIYSDLRQGQAYKYPYIYDIDDIRQSLDNIILTNPGQRFFLPEFGAGLSRFLFSLPTNELASDIRDNVISAVSRWEPRVKLITKDSYVIAQPQYFRYILDLKYQVPSLGETFYSYKHSIASEVN